MASQAQPALWRDTLRAGAARSGALIGAAALFLLVLGLALALASYRPGDPSLNTASGGPALNLLGGPGAMVSDLLFALLGLPVVLMLPLGVIIALRLWRDRPVGKWRAMLLGGLAGVVLMGTALCFVSDAAVPALPGAWGGFAGLMLANALRWAIGFIGDPVAVLWTGRGVGVLAGLTGVVLWARALDLDMRERSRRLLPSPRWRAADEGGEDERDPPPVREAPRADADPDAPAPRPTPRPVAQPAPRPDPVIADRNLAPSAAKKPIQTSLDLRDNYRLPPLDLLTPPPPQRDTGIDKAALQRNARLLESVLDDFHVKGSIVEVRPGPVVTMYELEPAAGIKASRVVQLADDIARNMSAVSARVATIPGRSVIGIELPNAPQCAPRIGVAARAGRQPKL